MRFWWVEGWLELKPALVRNAIFLYIHHISALLVLFIASLVDAPLRQEMRGCFTRSAELFQATLLARTGHQVRGAVRGYCVATEMIRVGLVGDRAYTYRSSLTTLRRSGKTSKLSLTTLSDGHR